MLPVALAHLEATPVAATAGSSRPLSCLLPWMPAERLREDGRLPAPAPAPAAVLMRSTASSIGGMFAGPTILPPVAEGPPAPAPASLMCPCRGRSAHAGSCAVPGHPSMDSWPWPWLWLAAPSSSSSSCCCCRRRGASSAVSCPREEDEKARLIASEPPVTVWLLPAAWLFPSRLRGLRVPR